MVTLGRAGPAPKPTALRVLHGERPYRINTREPVPSGRLLEPPPGLGVETLSVWDETAAELEAMGIAAYVDRRALVCYCEAVVVHERATRELLHADLIVWNDKGTASRNPLLAVQKDASTTVRLWAREFGVTPASRVSLSADVPDPVDEADRLLS